MRQSSVDMTYNPEQSAEEMTRAARGGFKQQYMTQTNSVNTPIIERLDENEQLEYIFYNSTKGFRIFEADGEERTPHHEGGADGKRFLALTDQRILYIVGNHKKAGDEIGEFEYADITEVDANWGWTSGRINFTTTDGREFKFVDQGGLADDIEDAAEYIRERIESSDKEVTNASSDEARTVNTAGYIERPEGRSDQDRRPASTDALAASIQERHEGHEAAPLVVYTGPPEDEAYNAVGRRRSTFEDEAAGNVNGAELTSTGGKVFRVGYFESPIAARLGSEESVDYVLRNFADGLELNGETYEPGDGRRAVACLTDGRLLFVVGGGATDGGTTVDRVVSIPHERILQVRAVEDSLVVVALDHQRVEGADTMTCKFVVKNTAELPDAVEYLSARSDVSSLDQQAEAVEELAAEAKDAFTEVRHDEAITAAERARDAYDQYTSIVSDVRAESTGGVGGPTTSPSLPEPNVSRDDIESLLASAHEAKWSREYETHVQRASRLREDADATGTDYEQVVASLRSAHDIANEHGVGDPEQVRRRIEHIHEQRYEAHREQAESLLTNAEKQREAQEFTDAIASYEEALELFQQTERIATEHGVGDAETIRERVTETREQRHDLQVLSLGRAVSNVSVPAPKDETVDKSEVESTITELESLVQRLEGLDIGREEDLMLMQDEAETKLAISRFCRERSRARSAVECFRDGSYTDARDKFRAVADRVSELVAEMPESEPGGYDSEMNRIVEICEQNTEVARKAALGLADEDELRPIAPETDTAEAEGDIVEGRTEQLSDVSAPSRPAQQVETPSFDVNLTYGDLDKGDHIGSGGNADVYQATVTVDGAEQPVAVKEPRMTGTLHTEVVERFVAEAETWSKLDDHDHIVTVLDYGSEPLPWIALEYMDVGDLANERPTLTFEEKVDIATRVTDAVWHAHQRGIAHLDLKPENILFRSVDGTNVPKIADWGLAKMLLNHSKSVEGLSPSYSAPEQFDSDTYGTPDNQTDIYQLGVILYELFAGRHPFQGPPSKVMHSILHEQPEPPSAHEPDLPEKLDDLLLTALSKEKNGRYEAAIYLRDAFQTMTLK